MTTGRPHYDDSVRDPLTGAKSEWTLLIYLTGVEDGVEGGEVCQLTLGVLCLATSLFSLSIKDNLLQGREGKTSGRDCPSLDSWHCAPAPVRYTCSSDLWLTNS